MPPRVLVALEADAVLAAKLFKPVQRASSSTRDQPWLRASGDTAESSFYEFRKALDEAGTDYEFDIYAKSKHSFTVPDADTHGNPGMSYNKLADERSWSRLQRLFAEKLGTPRS